LRLKSEVEEELNNLGTDVDEQKKAAALYTQAGDYQKTARFYYKKAEDTYYQVHSRSLTNTSSMKEYLLS
jgi:hypothetical protein